MSYFWYGALAGACLVALVEVLRLGVRKSQPSRLEASTPVIAAELENIWFESSRYNKESDRWKYMADALKKRWAPLVSLVLLLLVPACAHQAEKKRATAEALTKADASTEGYRTWLRGYVPSLTDKQLVAAEEVHRHVWPVLQANDAALKSCLDSLQPRGR